MGKPPILRLFCVLLIGVLSPACDRKEVKSQATSPTGGVVTAGDKAGLPKGSFEVAHKAFSTRLTRQESAHEALVQPPPAVLTVVKFDSPVGKLSAYLSPIPKDGKKRPAIVWIFGGFDNGIGETAWEKATPDNDQSASAFRQEGIITMYASLRGGNDNPGNKEAFFGEVDDVLAAADFLAQQEGIDPNRIYLGGHSTGGTLAMLASAAGGKRFRAVIAFGPVDNVAGYGPESLPFDLNKKPEVVIRSPGYWLDDVQTRTLVLEGTSRGNLSSLREMSRNNSNPLISFHEVTGNHFSILAPMTRLIAKKIAKDVGPETNLTISLREAKTGRE